MECWNVNGGGSDAPKAQSGLRRTGREQRHRFEFADGGKEKGVVRGGEREEGKDGRGWHGGGSGRNLLIRRVFLAEGARWLARLAGMTLAGGISRTTAGRGVVGRTQCASRLRGVKSQGQDGQENLQQSTDAGKHNGG